MNPRLVTTDVPVEDTHPHLVVERGKNNQGVGSWVVHQKYLYLCTYIDAARGASKKWPHRVFIDPFCGPGRVQVRDEEFTRPNGAMCAWLQSKKSGAPLTKMLVADIDPLRSEACRARLEGQGANVAAFVGPANDTVNQMIELVPSGALCFAYIDPYNLPLLDFRMISVLAKIKRIDFIVYFSTMDLARNIDAELDPRRARFDEVSPGWRARVVDRSKKNLAVAFFDDWQKSIQSLGFMFSGVAPPITNDDHINIYRLVFFAKHKLPIQLWGDIAKQPNLEMFDT